MVISMELPKRKPNRLKKYDYSTPGYYFVNICTKDKKPMLSEMPAPTISTVINQMKGYVTKKAGISLWQKLFHDHIIRGEKDYQKIWQYINANPVCWKDDCFYLE